MIGKQVRLNKLFDKNKNAVIVAIDHGAFVGPIPGLVDIHETIHNINPGVDGILLSPGMISNCQDAFSYKGAPMPIVRLNWSTAFCFSWNYSKASTTPTKSVPQAVADGAEMILVSLTLRTGNEETDARNINIFCKYVEEAQKLGIPIIGEYFPVNSSRLSDDEFNENIYTGCRIMAELGADLIKTFYTKNFKDVVKACPIPIFALGGDLKSHPVDALKLAWDVIQDGARGVIFGRNALQVTNPKDFQAALCDVVKNGISPAEATETYHLD